MIPRDFAPQHFESDEASFHAVLLLFQQRITADEFSLFEFHDRTEAGLQKTGRSVHVVAVEKHSALEPEAVAGSEAGRLQSVLRTGLVYSIPNGCAVFRREVQFK